MKDIDPTNADRTWKLILDAVEAGKDFALEQAPMIAQEIVVWKRFWHTAMLAVCIIAVAVCVRLGKRWAPHIKSENSPDDVAPYFIGTLLCMIGGVAACIGAANSFYYASMVWFAPRVYLVEYLTDILKHK